MFPVLDDFGNGIVIHHQIQRHFPVFSILVQLLGPRTIMCFKVLQTLNIREYGIELKLPSGRSSVDTQFPICPDKTLPLCPVIFAVHFVTEIEFFALCNNETKIQAFTRQVYR